MLLRTWLVLNESIFNNQLSPPLLIEFDDKKKLGYYSNNIIGISKQCLLNEKLLFEVMKHEMVHQYVHKVLKVHYEPPHGFAFKRVCRQFGISTHASIDVPIPEPVKDSFFAEPTIESKKIREKIKKLLALAESPNENEARVAASKAYELMLRYNIQSSDLRTKKYESILIGPIKKRIERHEKMMGSLLNLFFVYSVFSLEEDGYQLEITGTPENLEIASWVYDFMNRTILRLWEEKKKIDPTAKKYRYLSGLVYGFILNMQVTSKKSKEEGLIWVRDKNLEEFANEKYPSLRTKSINSFSGSDFSSGIDQGKKIVLSKPIKETNSSRNKMITGL